MDKNCFSIKIFDTDNLQDVTELNYAENGSISLRYNGGDDKLQFIVGSDLTFTIEDYNFSDGRFDKFYTENETKWLVELWGSSFGQPQSLKWRGFLMPEQYREPWANEPLYIELTATDGLGRLRGKELPAQSYVEEKQLMKFLADALKQTGLSQDIYFSPSFNNLTKEWKDIYLYGKAFIDDKENPDFAADVVEKICKSLRCTLYSELGAWFLVGHNKGMISEVTYQHYNVDGDFVESKTISKEKTDVSKLFFPTPVISIVPKVGKVALQQKFSPVQLPKNVEKQENEGYSLQEGNTEFSVPTDWVVSGIFNARIKLDDGKLHLGQTLVADDTAFIVLRSPNYIEIGKKFTFKNKFTLIQRGDDDTSGESYVAASLWENKLKVEMRISSDGQNGPFSIYNYSFNPDRSSENEHTVISSASGYVMLKIFRPIGLSSTDGVFDIVVDEMKITDIEMKDDDVEKVVTISDDTSVEVELELPLTDDVLVSDFSFRNEPLRVENQTHNDIEVSIISTFQQGAKKFVRLSPADLVFLNGYKNTVFVQRSGIGELILIPEVEVIFNYLDGEQMLFSYNDVALSFTILASDKIFVRVTTFQLTNLARTDWRLWIDDVAKMNPRNHAQLCIDMIERHMKLPHIAIEGTIDAIVSFSNLVKFFWKTERVLQVTNLSIDLTSGTSDVFLVESFYGNSFSENIPPFVDAGSDQTLNTSETSTIVTATASDPDGIILVKQWSVLQGSATIESPNELRTIVRDISTDLVELQILVEDDGGLQATDAMTIQRIPPSAISEEVTFSTANIGVDVFEQEKWRQIIFTPALNVDSVILLSYDIELFVDEFLVEKVTKASIEVVKNGNTELIRELKDFAANNTPQSLTSSFQSTVTSEDSLIFKMISNVSRQFSGDGPGTARTKVTITNATDTSGKTQITGLPLVFNLNSQLT